MGNGRVNKRGACGMELRRADWQFTAPASSVPHPRTVITQRLHDLPAD